MNRREFLKQSLAVTGGISLLGMTGTRLFAQTEPLYKISLAQWSLHNTLFAGDLDHLDFAKVTKNDYGIDAVEYVNQFFKDKAKDMAYLREMNTIADGEGITQLLIMIDGEGNLGDPKKKKRIQAVENHYPWVEAAKFLGCHSIRVNARSSGSYKKQMKLAIDGLRRLTEFGAEHDINIIVENHGGISSNGKWLSAVIKGVDSPHCGTLPDFGNFRISKDEEYDRYLGIEELMPYAKGVSAKSHDFDEEGNETHTDFLRMLKIVLDSGYRGYVDVEYEGSELSEPDGIRATKALLERVREELAPSYS
ncbi:MAG: TIM barrel protein [Candidatus Marinimicrobia bacterium]|nr:TIM barrel protein [Candidatus Neomarinimicrobiota bacterium]